MADDRTTDHFIREVDEELRRDQLKALWDRFGAAFVAICVLIVIVTAGYRGWLWWQERQAAASGDRYLAALDAAEAGEVQTAEAALAVLAQEGSGGYPLLARLRAAALAADSDDVTGAIAAFDAVAADGRADPAIRDLARIRAGLLALSAGDLDGAAQRAEGLAVAGPWRNAAREILGAVALQRGELAAAREHFAAIQADVEAPPAAQGRAEALVTLIDGMSAPPAAATDATINGATNGAASDTHVSQ